MDSALVEEAVRRVRDGDREALHFLYVRFAADAKEAVGRRGAAPAEVEELTARLFLSLPERIAGYRPQQPFADWLAGEASLGERHAA